MTFSHGFLAGPNSCSTRNEEIYAMFMLVIPFGPNFATLTVILTDVYNKIDSISLEQVDKLARQPNTVVISCEMDLK